MEFANNVVTLIANIIGCGLILVFLVGLVYAIRFMLQVKTQDKEDFDRRKKKEELDYKETELRYKRLQEDRR